LKYLRTPTKYVRSVLSILMLTILIPFSTNTQAQKEIYGYVNSKTGEAIEACTVLLFPQDPSNNFQLEIPNSDGYFHFDITTDSIPYVLVVQGIAFYPDTILLERFFDTSNLPLTFTLFERISPLDTIYVSATAPKIIINNDTITFDAKQYRGENDKRIIDILENMPGIRVDRETGTITYRNRPVETILINGSDVFRSDYDRAVRIIGSDIIDKVEVIRDYHDNYLEKGLYKSNEVALNLKTYEKAKSFNGEAGVLVGYQGKYLGVNGIIIVPSGTGFVDLSTNNLSQSGDFYELGRVKSRDNSMIGYDPRNTHYLSVRPTSPRVYDNDILRGQLQSSYQLSDLTEVNIQVGSHREFFLKNEDRVNNYTSLVPENNTFQRLTDSLSNQDHRLYSKVELARKGKDSTLYKISLLGFFSESISNNSLSLDNLFLSSSLSNGKNGVKLQNSFSKRLSSSSLLDIDVGLQRFSSESNFNSDGIILPETDFNESFINATSTTNQKFFATGTLLLKSGGGSYRIGLEGYRQSLLFKSDIQNGISASSEYTFDNASANISCEYNIGSYKVNLIASPKYFHQILNINDVVSKGADWTLIGGITLQRKVSTRGKLELSGYKDQAEFDFSYLNPVRIYNSGNSFQVGTNEIMPVINQMNLAVSYDYLNLYSQNNFNVSMSYSHDSGSFTPITIADERSTYFVFDFIERSVNNINFSAVHQFLFNAISTKIGFNGEYSRSLNYANINESEINDTESSSSTVGLSLKSAFPSWFNYRLRTKWVSNNFKFEPSEINQTSLETNLRFLFRPVKEIKISIDNIFAKLKTDTSAPVQQYFLDFRISYIPLKSRVEFYAQGGNVLGNKRFVRITSSPISQSTQTINTYPSYFVVGGNYNLK
jgi:hypothetical protein